MEHTAEHTVLISRAVEDVATLTDDELGDFINIETHCPVCRAAIWGAAGEPTIQEMSLLEEEFLAELGARYGF